MLRRIMCSTLLLSLSPFSWSIEEVLVTGTRPSGEIWKPWGSNYYTELTQLNQTSSKGYVAYHDARRKACALAESDINIKHKGCQKQAETKYTTTADSCPLDTEVMVAIPGFVSATTNPRAACMERASNALMVARSECGYKKAVSEHNRIKTCK